MNEQDLDGSTPPFAGSTGPALPPTRQYSPTALLSSSQHWAQNLTIFAPTRAPARRPRAPPRLSEHACYIVIPGDEVKNGKTLHYKLSEPTISISDTYLGNIGPCCSRARRIRRRLFHDTEGRSVHAAGELGIAMAAALPLGAVAGLGLGYLIVWHLDNDLFQVPLVVGWRTYAIAISRVLAAATLSFALAARRLQSIDIPRGALDRRHLSQKRFAETGGSQNVKGQQDKKAVPFRERLL